MVGKKLAVAVAFMVSTSAGAYLLGGGRSETWLSPEIGKHETVTAGDMLVEARGVFLPEMVQLLGNPQQPAKLKDPVHLKAGDLMLRVDTTRALKACLTRPSNPLDTLWEDCLIDD